MAVDKNGHIITVDNKACCVFIFQSNGKLVTKFGARGTSDRHFAGIVLYFGKKYSLNKAAGIKACDWARFTDIFIYFCLEMFLRSAWFLYNL